MSVVDVCKFPYQLFMASAEGVQMGLEIIGGNVDLPPTLACTCSTMECPLAVEGICDEAEADDENEFHLAHEGLRGWQRIMQLAGVR